MLKDFKLISHLFFANEKVLARVKKEVLAYPSVEAQWQGACRKKMIDEGYLAEVKLEWISPEVGYGVFALKTLKKGAYIGEYVGQVKRFFPFRWRRNDYVGEYRVAERVPLRFIIDAEHMGNLTRFINHSDKPNLRTMTVVVSGLLHVIFIAIEDIPEGVQLTFNYGPTYWKKRSAPLNLYL